MYFVNFVADRLAMLNINPEMFKCILLILLQIDWLAYINSIFSDTGIEVTADERIIVSQPRYLREILVLVKSTPARVIGT